MEITKLYKTIIDGKPEVNTYENLIKQVNGMVGNKFDKVPQELISAIIEPVKEALNTSSSQMLAKLIYPELF